MSVHPSGINEASVADGLPGRKKDDQKGEEQKERVVQFKVSFLIKPAGFSYIWQTATADRYV